MGKKSSIKVGDIYPTNEGGRVRVVEYVKANHVVVQHIDEHGHIAITQGSHLRRGVLKNPFRKSVVGIGYMGNGPHCAWRNGKITDVYMTWKHMLERVYSEVELEKYPTYRGCSVCEEWHNLQNFAGWYYQQPNAGKKNFRLDKDLINWGNKVYCPEACSFVPNEVNCLLTDCGAARGPLPQGVFEQNGKYVAHLSINSRLTRVGSFYTPEDAHEAYRKAKSKQVKVVAERNKEFLHPKVYENLMKWELV